MSGGGGGWTPLDTSWRRAVLMAYEGVADAPETMAALEAALGEGGHVCSSLNEDGYSLAALAHNDQRQEGSGQFRALRGEIKSFVARALDIHSVNHLGMTALAQGLKFNVPGLARLALPGSDVGRADPRGETPLMLASMLDDGREEELFDLVLGACIAGGAPLDARDEMGRTALMMAAGSGNDRSVIELLLAGASPILADAMGRSAFHHAAAQGYANPIDILGSSEPDGSPIRAAASILDAEGFSPLCLAAKHGWSKCVGSCLALHAEGAVEGPGGSTALMWAAGKGSAESVELLLRRSDPSARDDLGRSASDWARDLGNAAILAACERAELGWIASGSFSKSGRPKAL